MIVRVRIVFSCIYGAVDFSIVSEYGTRDCTVSIKEGGWLGICFSRVLRVRPEIGSGYYADTLDVYR